MPLHNEVASVLPLALCLIPAALALVTAAGVLVAWFYMRNGIQNLKRMEA